MTEREVYEATKLELGKYKAPSFYIEDFNYTFNKAVQDWTNVRYAQYAISQQLDDDLQNLLRVVYINNNHPYPMNITDKNGNIVFAGDVTSSIRTGVNLFQYERQPDPASPSLYKTVRWFSYDGILRENKVFNLSNNTYGYDAIYFTDEDGVIRDDLWDYDNDERVFNKELIIGIQGEGAIINDYRYENYGSNNNGGTFVSTDTLNNENIPFSFNLTNPGKRVVITGDNVVFFKFNYTTKMFDQLETEGYTISTDSVDVLTPPDYLHLVELSVGYRFKNRKDCDDWSYKSYSAKRLTADRSISVLSNSYLKPMMTRPYYMVQNNIVSTKPELSILFGNDIETGLKEVNTVELKYLKEPKKVLLTDEDIELEADRTDNMEFPDYICYELVNRCVTLILERTTDSRIQTQPVITESNALSRELK